MAEQEYDVVHSDVDIIFEKAKRMLLGQPVACEMCGLDDDGVEGYEYPKSKKRVMLCRQHAEKQGFCFGCHEHHKDIAAHMASCRMVEYDKEEQRHEAVLDWVEIRANELKAARAMGDAQAVAVIEAYKAYVEDDLYPDDELERLEAAIAAYTD
jgi:hypothetical protein